MDENFVSWLVQEKMGKNSAHDVVSRLKRVNSYKVLNLKTPDHKYIYELYQDESFQKLGVTIKSQLKRAVNLYYEYSKKEYAVSE